MKVLHITFNMCLGGTQQVIRHLIEHLDSTKFENYLLCIDGEKGELGQLVEDTVADIHLLQRQPGFDFQLIKSIRSYIRKHDIDVVHCHQYTPYFYGALATITTGKSVVFTEHGRFYPDVVGKKRQLFNQFLGLLTSHVTAISQATLDALEKLERLPKNKMKLIYNGIPDPDFTSPAAQQKCEELSARYQLDKDHFIFGTISRLEPIKNQRLMIRAFANVHKTNAMARLLVIGDGPLMAELKTLANELGVGESVIFTGFITDPQIYLSLFDVFLLPSFSEGTSMTLLEAMSASTPCIVSNVGGSPEIVLDGETGLVVTSDNEIELTSAMESLLNDEARRTSMGQSGRQRYVEHFSAQSMADAYATLYQ